MRDFATSDDPAVQAQLDRLGALSLPQGRFGLETIREILARLGDPQDHLPPVFHVGGTNGKGSTCAFLHAMLEAQGLVVHTATKPHLVRYNERIRLAGHLIADAELAAVLAEVLDTASDLGPSFFEVTTAAMFLAFARAPADACVIEVGLGGRFDATNVMTHPAACGITALGIDHEAFLLRPEPGVPTDPLARIAFEKAGIARAGVPLVTQAYDDVAAAEIERCADAAGADLAMRGREWNAAVGATLTYSDRFGTLDLPLPALAGTHQADNAALAVAILRHQRAITVTPQAMATGIRNARWPARMQQLGAGPLTARLPGRRVWLDGAHNRNAATALAAAMAQHAPFDLVFALMGNRAPADVLGPLAPLVARAVVVPVPGHEGHDPQVLADWARPNGIPNCRSAPTLAAGLDLIAEDPAPRDVLIAGSLYLAGEVLRRNDEIPD
jgi:dihydrofolate synthase/folylpolyglutamate synthase